MTIARVFGGLGNQLFIYAAARALALRNDTALALDTVSGFASDHYYRRQLMLHYFNIKYERPSKYDLFTQPTRWGSRIRVISRRLDKKLPWRYRFYITEAEDFIEQLLRLPVRGRTYLEGYWQNEKYFMDYKEVIRQDLTIVTPLDERSIELGYAMRECD